MSKRKRDDAFGAGDGGAQSIEDRAIRAKISRFQAKLEQSNKVLKDAVQLARGFERQKLGRRQKQAEKQPQMLLRLREEAIIVRQMDASKVAKDYLFKQFIKTKRIRQSPAFVSLYGDDPKFESAKSAAEANVLGRLFKSNPVKEVLPNILRDIRHVLGLDEIGAEPGSSSTQSKKGELRPLSKDLSDENEFTSFPDEANQQGAEARKKLLEGITDLEMDLSDADSDEDEDTLDMYKAHDNRLAASSDDDNTSVNHDSEKSHSEHEASAYSQSDTDIEEVGETFGETEEHPTNQPRSQPKKSIPATEKLSKTTFLPSLSMGGYYSGSESGADIDGYNDKDRERDATAVQQRKNRRGQRARQEIAERKYGKNAKHLASTNKRKESQNARDQRNSGSRRSGPGRQQQQRYHRGKRGPTGANDDAVDPARARARKDGRVVPIAKTNSNNSSGTSLHPSWEAARKKKIESSTASFAGKKITFD